MISDSRNQAAKQAMLARIREANGPGSSTREAERARDLAQIPRDFRRRGTLPMPERIELFQAILKHYGATSYVTPGANVANETGRILRERARKRLVVPPDFPESWVPAGVEIVRDSGLGNDELDKMDGVISGCTVAIASTGSIVVAGGRDGRRAITLVPDYQLCIVKQQQLVEFMAEALEVLKDLKSAPLTFFSGPSATVDIEMTRVQGVHGPRTLDVVIAT